MPSYFIGLMSGTSIDGVDAVLVDFTQEQYQVVATYTQPFPKHLFKGLQRLSQPGSDEVNRLGRLDRQVADVFAEAVNGLLEQNQIDSSQVVAIGSHGQTIRHMPNLENSFSIQIGDPNTIAVKTGIDVIADFRRKDIALGGQGAPLVPAFHQQIFASKKIQRIILNIGGIANITYLPVDGSSVVGFDTGPGNALMDSWIQQRLEQAYDNNGEWAASGTTDPTLLNHLLSHTYFSQPFPKSTGKELFSQAWLTQQLSEFIHLPDEDIQSTLLDLTCMSISDQISKLSPTGELFVCGGGALNSEMMKRLKALQPNYRVTTTSELGLDPKWVEAVAFAWLAYRYTQGLSGNLPDVTGASRTAILGAMYPAN
ncbi:anhydro-N-acetylmuramic acid kinase [Parashewanella curva]|uniref:Anhydro-N-acetylmuramic acid kinase n=1 Tax=Parashewanella curva TaxID=2338552 RepID=A0A3L8PU92_9GAMM|nr:anhydro-N-acetylmuramic acid kinase [Parashewanella curva]RLV58874.1 anhydro-N-acetylmuramic acid kinase [Parashewanella curva]